MVIPKNTIRPLALLLTIAVLTACSAPGTSQTAGGQAAALSEASNAENPSESAAAPSEASGTDNPSESEAAQSEASGAELPSEAAAADENADTPSPLPDGTYTPTLFTVSGGTGKVTFTCPEVLVTAGEAVAVIELGSSHYEWLKVDGVQYDAENADEAGRKNSVFRIPVLLDEEMAFSGLTTAMSEPHEVEYTLLISLTRKNKAAEGAAGAEPAPETEAPSAGAEASAAGAKAPSAGAEAPSAGAEASAAGAEDLSNAEKTDAGDTAESESSGGGADSPGNGTSQSRSSSEPPAIEGLTFVSAMEKVYAETFDIYTYSLTGGSSDALCRLIDVHGSAQYLLLPETTAENTAARQALITHLPDTITILEAPLDNIYVAGTSSMALFDAAGAIGQVRLTGTKADGWYIDAPKNALAEGSMVYAGKYSAPDYELLAVSGCDLAVENTMILHTPEVKEKLEELGIPVFIDISSNESHPLGRTEWVRLYGVLTGHEQEAEAFFEREKEEFAKAETYTDTGLTVAFFSISTNGKVIVRATDDYVPRMIELAGGEYIFRDLLNEGGNSASVRISMEDFYNTARDADFLIYNATIESPVESAEELCSRSALLNDFKAVQKGRVWQVRRSLYQSPDIAARMITDLRGMLTGGDDEDLTFLERLK